LIRQKIATAAFRRSPLAGEAYLIENFCPEKLLARLTMLLVIGIPFGVYSNVELRRLIHPQS